MKKNAVELARKELAKMPETKRRGTMLLSSVTDPYQGHETKYRLTRGILRELKAVEYPGLVRILTKSPVVTRDIDLLTSLPRAEVGMTVTTTDDKVSRWLEVRAPLASRRLRTLAELNEAGIPTYAFVGPLLPHFATQRELLDDLFGRLVDAGVSEVFMEHINLKRYIRERMDQVLADEPEDVREAYLQARTRSTANSSTRSWRSCWTNTGCGCASRRSSTTTTTTPCGRGSHPRRDRDRDRDRDRVRGRRARCASGGGLRSPATPGVGAVVPAGPAVWRRHSSAVRRA